MKRYALLSAAVVAVVPTVMYAGSVNLQDETPGVPQAGHLNITGTAKAGTVVGYSNTASGIAYGGDFRSVSTSGRGVLGNASAPTGVTYGGLFQSFSTSGRGIAGITSATTGPTVGGFFTANSINGKGVQGSSNALSGLNYGVYGRNVSPEGFALYAEGNVSTTGNVGIGLGTTPASERLVVNGNAAITGTVSGNGSGLSNLNANALGSGTVPDARLSSNVPLLNTVNTYTGQYNLFQKNIFIGAFGSSYGTERLSINGTGSSTGMGVNTSGSGNAFYSYKTNGKILSTDWNGTTWGVSDISQNWLALSDGRLALNQSDAGAELFRAITFDNSTNTPTAVIGNGPLEVLNGYARVGAHVYSKGTGLNVALGAHAVSSDSDSYGVVGSATGAVNNYGVFGSAFNGSGDNYAGYFDGALFAISASATVKSFLIDHPLDPANKFLRHSSIESDQRMNIYRGEVTTDSSGLAVVTMPTWFEALNGKIQYQLTVVDESESSDFVLTKVAQRLRHGKFKIRTSAPNVTVNWMVSGERHDPTSQYMPLVVEEEKRGTSRGKYLVPEAYGKDESFGMVARPKVRLKK